MQICCVRCLAACLPSTLLTSDHVGAVGNFSPAGEDGQDEDQNRCVRYSHYCSEQ